MLELRVGSRMGRNKERVVGPSNGRKQNDPKEKESHTEILRSHSMHCWGIIKKGLTSAGSKLGLERQIFWGRGRHSLGLGLVGKIRTNGGNQAFYGHDETCKFTKLTSPPLK